MGSAEEPSVLSDLDTNAEEKQEETPEPPQAQNQPNDYNINNVVQQLNGAVEHWFKFAANVPSEKKELFLAIGERIDEIAKLLAKDFSNV